MKVNNLLVVCCFGIIAVLTSGCAFGTREIALNYPPQESGSNLAYASEDASNFKRERIILFQFENQRPAIESSSFENQTEKDIVGHVRNGYELKNAKIVSSTNVEEWITSAVAYELRKNGYEVLNKKDKTAVSEKHCIKLHGTTLFVYADSFANYNGRIAFNVSIKARSGNKTIFTKTYQGNKKTFNFAASAKGYKQVLEMALADAVYKLVNDINSLLSSMQS